MKTIKIIITDAEGVVLDSDTQTIENNIHTIAIRPVPPGFDIRPDETGLSIGEGA